MLHYMHRNGGGKMTNIGLIMLGGALGAVLRYLVCLPFHSDTPGFPTGTLTANLAGCFLIGLLFAGTQHLELADHTKLFIFVGILGAFTTFSSFGLESIRLIEGGLWRTAAIYILLSNFMGLALVAAGFFAARGIGAMIP